LVDTAQMLSPSLPEHEDCPEPSKIQILTAHDLPKN